MSGVLASPGHVAGCCQRGTRGAAIVMVTWHWPHCRVMSRVYRVFVHRVCCVQGVCVSATNTGLTAGGISSTPRAARGAGPPAPPRQGETGRCGAGLAGLGWAGLPIININNLICQPALVIAADRKWAAAGQLPRARGDKWLAPAASISNTLPNS